MPLYEYRCRSCAHEFEALVRGSESLACPACQSGDLERLLSSFGVSSDAIRQSNLKAGRKAMAKENKEKAIADHEATHHSHDH